MKKKQFMSKLAALTMAAAMGVTALPATVMAADEVPAYAAETSVPASNAAIQADETGKTTNLDKAVSVTVTTQGNMDTNEQNAIKTITKTVNNENFDPNTEGKLNSSLFNSGKNNAVQKDAADTLKTLLVETYGKNNIANLNIAGVEAADAKEAVAGTAKITTSSKDEKTKVTDEDITVSADVKNGKYTYAATAKDVVAGWYADNAAEPEEGITIAEGKTPVDKDTIEVSGHQDAVPAVKGVTAQASIISNVAITDTDNWSYTITDLNGNQANVTVKTGHTYGLTDKVSDILNEYFENLDAVETYGGKGITSRQVATKLKGDKTTWAELTEAGVTDVTGDDTLVKDGKGTIKVALNVNATDAFTRDGKAVDAENTPANSEKPSADYGFEITVDAHDEKEDDAIKSALASIDGSTYADPADEKLLEAKISEDLVAAGAPKGTKVDGKYTAATATKDGSWYITKDDNVYKVTLKYSSASKLADTQKAIKKALVGATQTKAEKWDVDPSKEGEDEKEGTVYTYGATSKFSTALQAKDATKAVSTEDVKAAVEKTVTDKLASEKVADNGVKVEVLSANDDASKPAVFGTEGEFYFVVSASIRNDFFGYTDGTQQKNASIADRSSEDYFLVNVKTGALKLVETTGLELADQTVEYVANVNKESDGKFHGMLVKVTPTVTPEGSNDTLEYIVKDHNGNDVTKKLEGDHTYVDAEGNAKILGAGEFIFSDEIGAGKYIVEVKVKDNKDIKASATLTLKDSFNDAMDDTKYYRESVRWAYQNGISNGVGNDNFGVNKTVSRGEFVTWLYRLAQKANAVTDVKGDASTLKFTDVNKDAYYAEAVAWAAKEGIVNGTSDTTFSPNAEVTRGQVATFLYRLNGSDVSITAGNSEKDATVNFTDIAGSYYTTPITWAAQNGYVSGKTTTTFAPNDKATRAEGITMIHNAFEHCVK